MLPLRAGRVPDRRDIVGHYQKPEAAVPLDRNSLLGGNPLGVAVRLALLSIAAGIVMKALGINLRNFFDRINQLLRSLYDLGFEMFDWVLEYLLLGAIVVIPVWIVARLLSVAKDRPD